MNTDPFDPIAQAELSTPAAAPSVTPAVADATGQSQDAAPSDGAAGVLTPDLVKLALRKVKDPELNLNIVDLGLIYDIRVEGNDVQIDMSLTSPACPSGPELMGDAEKAIKALDGVGTTNVNLVWTPMWSPDRIEPRVRAYLGF
jgi:metal-sulfur cluster biosynthetic enzyme